MAAYNKKAQTEKKAKGLAKGAGDYKGKTLNLTKKQLGKSGTAAAQKRTVDISATKYEAGSKKVLGPGGKPLTGSVDLGGGNMAVYKNGVRVRATAPKSSAATTKSKESKSDTSATPATKTGYKKAAKAQRSSAVSLNVKQDAKGKSRRAQAASGARYSGMANKSSAAKTSSKTSGDKYSSNREAFFNNPLGYVFDNKGRKK